MNQLLVIIISNPFSTTSEPIPPLTSHVRDSQQRPVYHIGSVKVGLWLAYTININDFTTSNYFDNDQKAQKALFSYN